MTPKISFITAVVGAALVFAVPAFGDSWGADQDQATVHVSPDLVDRVDASETARAVEHARRPRAFLRREE